MCSIMHIKYNIPWKEKKKKKIDNQKIMISFKQGNADHSIHNLRAMLYLYYLETKLIRVPSLAINLKLWR